MKFLKSYKLKEIEIKQNNLNENELKSTSSITSVQEITNREEHKMSIDKSVTVRPNSKEIESNSKNKIKSKEELDSSGSPRPKSRELTSSIKKNKEEWKNFDSDKINLLILEKESFIFF